MMGTGSKGGQIRSVAPHEDTPSQINQVLRETPPKSRNGPRNEEQSSRSEPPLTPGFQGERQGLPSQFWSCVSSCLTSPTMGANSVSFRPWCQKPRGRTNGSLARLDSILDDARPTAADNCKCSNMPTLSQMSGVKHRPNQHQAAGEPMEERAHPCSLTEIISTLINHDHSWHVNNLQTTIEFKS
jgi:hypothetical protein